MINIMERTRTVKLSSILVTTVIKGYNVNLFQITVKTDEWVYSHTMKIKLIGGISTFEDVRHIVIHIVRYSRWIVEGHYTAII